MNPKPTYNKPHSDGAKLHQKEFDKEMNIVSLEEVDNDSSDGYLGYVSYHQFYILYPIRVQGDRHHKL